MAQNETTANIRQRFFVGSAALGLLALAFWGCGNSSVQPSKVTNQSAGPKASGHADSVASIDESFTPEEYIRLGLPAHDREWSGDDMVNVEKILASIAQKGYRHLPRYKSERSGVVFARLTSPQNLDLFRNRSLPLGPRLSQSLNYLQASNQVNKLYLSAFLKKDVRDSELVELMGSLLRSTAVLLELVDELLPTLNKDEPSYEVRMQGLE